MSLIKTFKLRNKMEIDMFVNDELLLTLTRPVYRDTSNTDDIIYFDLPNGQAELYVNPDKPNSLIYYTSSCDNQMALFLNDNEIDDFLLLSYESDTDTNSYTDSSYTDSSYIDSDISFDSDSKQHRYKSKDDAFSFEESDDEDSYDGVENEKDNEKNNEKKDNENKDNENKDNENKDNENEENEIEYIKVRVLERSVHPIDNNYFIYKIDVKLNSPIVCVSDKFYKIASFVNIDCYLKNIFIKGVLSYGKISSHKLGFFNWVKNWFGF